jgi:hypothetical protein
MNLDGSIGGGTLDPGSELGGPNKLWNALLPAVVNEDPSFHGDTTMFCHAYGTNSYAPDWQRP